VRYKLSKPTKSTLFIVNIQTSLPSESSEEARLRPIFVKDLSNYQMLRTTVRTALECLSVAYSFDDEQLRIGWSHEARLVISRLHGLDQMESSAWKTADDPKYAELHDLLSNAQRLSDEASGIASKGSREQLLRQIEGLLDCELNYDGWGYIVPDEDVDRTGDRPKEVRIGSDRNSCPVCAREYSTDPLRSETPQTLTSADV
jgi:hypothetical protein